MHRFFVAPDRIDGDDIVFPADLSRQMTRVLRMKAGDSVVALDDSGLEYLVKLSRVDRSLAEGRIVERREGAAEPRLSLSIYQAMVKADRFETLLQKCVELGVRRVVPVITRRTVARNAELSGGRETRWRRIIREASEQCGRSRLAELGSPMSLAEALDEAPRPAFIAWEGEKRVSLGAAMDSAAADIEARAELSVFIGPEGGFEPSEIDAAREAGLTTVGLGRRILRAETAAIAVAAIAMQRFGEI